MGTANPHVTITAATRKGSGRTNQDRYITGPNFAAVLDGASRLTEEQRHHDGGWYAETLGARLRELLTAHPDSPLAEIVERAIESVVAEHDLRPDTSPTSTIALARWGDEHLEIYVLGDSTVAVIHPDGHEDAYSDNRIASIGNELRREYRNRLASGSGFDDEHRRLLISLQAEQARWRNREGGYWIAAAEPGAAAKGLLREVAGGDLSRLALATDGAASSVTVYRNFRSWARLSEASPAATLARIEALEVVDGKGMRWPRSKAHDDKTLVVARLRT